MHFNFGNAVNDNSEMSPSANEKILNRKYIDGSVKKEFSFTLYIFKSVTTLAIVPASDVSNENIEDLSEIQEVIDWITEQNDLRNYPNFGEKFLIEEIATTTENPTLEGVNTEVKPDLAMYSIIIRVDYIDFTKANWS